jgi:hydroxymethylglutaryl-CoA reductase (NADPH)
MKSQIREWRTMNTKKTFTSIDTRWIGPIHLQEMNYLDTFFCDVDVFAPLSTYETTLFYSVARGAKVSRHCNNFKTTLLSDCMTRSVIFEAKDVASAFSIAKNIQSKIDFFQSEIVSKGSKYAILEKITYQIVSNLIFVRFVFHTANASGHNMTTIAADRISNFILENEPDLKYVSISGNFCVDKKVSAANSILGRGKHVIAECLIPREVCESVLRSTPEKIVDLNIKKNLIGSVINGGVASANAHYANMLLAFYLATGQDGANIVEGSQGVTYAEVRENHLYFSVNLPNIIVGTVGNGKSNSDATLNLEKMGCVGSNSAQKCAQIAASIVLCGELSLMAALTNKNELSNSHIAIERNPKA